MGGATPWAENTETKQSLRRGRREPPRQLQPDEWLQEEITMWYPPVN